MPVIDEDFFLVTIDDDVLDRPPTVPIALIDPLSLTDVTMYQNGDDPALVSPIANWPNGGSADDFVTASEPAKPTLDTIAGRQSVKFNGVANVLSLNSGTSVDIMKADEFWANGVIEIGATPAAAEANVFNNAAVWFDSASFFGLMFNVDGTFLFLWDGMARTTGEGTDPMTAGSRHYWEARHEGGVGFFQLGNNPERSATIGDVTVLTNTVRLAMGGVQFGDYEIGEKLIASPTIPSVGEIDAMRRRARVQWDVITP